MTMPVPTHFSKHGEIRVIEDEGKSNFLVRIHPEDKDRVKKISGRQWDGHRKYWVFPKILDTYDSLCDEFKKDADEFTIRKPKTKRPPNITTPDQDQEDEFERSYLDEDNQELRSTLIDGIETVKVNLEILKGYSDSQNLIMAEIRSDQAKLIKQQQSLNKTLEDFEVVDEIDDTLPKNIDFESIDGIQLFDQALIEIAQNVCCEESFKTWMKGSHPFSNPSDFVTETHEALKKMLFSLLGFNYDADYQFHDLILEAKFQNFFYTDKHDLFKPIQTLFSLNHIKNKFSHPDRNINSKYEKQNASIIYLLNLAQIWSKMTEELEETENE